MLEAALDDASTNGSLHLAALALRTQIEELDVLGPLGRLKAQLADGNVEATLFWQCCVRVLRGAGGQGLCARATIELLTWRATHEVGIDSSMNTAAMQRREKDFRRIGGGLGEEYRRGASSGSETAGRERARKG
jgi:hypothetical protein